MDPPQMVQPCELSVLMATTETLSVELAENTHVPKGFRWGEVRTKMTPKGKGEKERENC